jgi:flagellar biogenesis protein FliO
MHPAIEGALVGAGVALFLVGTEYLLLKKAMNERAQRFKRKAEFDITERRRIGSMTRFALVLPPAFALGFWILWG